MRFERELLPGAWLVPLRRLQDERGHFVKTFARSAFEAALGAAAAQALDWREEFYSLSQRDVIRGMHFQLPPHDHVKMVYCAAGAVDDVLLDLRPGPGYGRVASVRLDAQAPAVLLVPKGVAHGFRALADNALMVYKTSSEHVPSHDAGVRYDSFGHDWGCAAPVLSARDRQHPALADFVSPFPASAP